MRCSKCWLWKSGCLDGNHHREVTLMLADGAAREDRSCPAMRAVMRVAKSAGDCPRRDMLPDRKGRDYCRKMKCAECLARWATGGKR
jgi:hypothetical protein